MGCDLLAWFRLLCYKAELAIAEPATLRYALLHTSARLVRGQRRRTVKIPRTWPWADQLQRALSSVLALPVPI
ncbi:transposase [Nonomuraea sp. NEAU-A123]|uniref:transposase n=1 Tax=Nonomuraea sp. NEAU-A123 TaxID=2839649 RepID=UPI0027DEDA26|nr:transposase [Nonomuraea sp. NEAU-A123]